eukprot:m.135083 g.135083  ORF g.135083 m.135083 type:complete len:573 (-) comp15838_c1_seq1:2131-3849(-)
MSSRHARKTHWPSRRLNGVKSAGDIDRTTGGAEMAAEALAHAREDDAHPLVLSFTAQYLQSPPLTLVGVSVGDKTAIVRLLAKLAAKNTAFADDVFLALRICSRDAAGMEPLYTLENFKLLLDRIRTTYQAECAKIIINALLTAKDTIGRYILEAKVAEELVAIVGDISQEAPLDGDKLQLVQLCLQAAFVVTATYSTAVQALQDQNKLAPLIHCVSIFITSQPAIACESLKLLFVVCSQWWKQLDERAANLVSAISSILHRLAPFLWDIMRHELPSSALLRAAVEFFVAVPASCMPALFGHELKVEQVLQWQERLFAAPQATKIEEVHWDPDMPEVTERSERVLEQPTATTSHSTLRDLLTLEDMETLALLVRRLEQLREIKWDNDAQLRDHLAPVAVTLRNACLVSLNARRFLATTVLPKRKDFTQGPEKGDTLSAWLIRLLTSPAENMNVMVGELLFLICNQRLSRFLRRVGYGNAAGYLSMRGLPLAPPSEQEAPVDEQHDSSSEDEVIDDLDPITGKKMLHEPVQWASEEEKEHRAHELLVLIQRLNALGIIKCDLPHPDSKPEDDM